MRNNLVKNLICSLFIFLIAADGSVASEDVKNALVAKLKFSKFDIFIYPSNDLSKSGYGSADGSFGSVDSDNEDALWYESWISENESILCIDNSLFVDNKHYLIPDLCKEIWIINGKVLDPNEGPIQESKVPNTLEKEMKAERDDVGQIAEGVEFHVENAFVGGSSFKRYDDLNWRFAFGGCFFKVKNGNLIYRKKDYGRLEKGDKVVVDKDDKVSITKNPTRK